MFELCDPAVLRRRGAKDAMEAGKDGEALIESGRRNQLLLLDKPNYPRDWQLIFADPLDGSTKGFVASRLKVKGEPFRCLPDLVFRQERTGEIIVVERKVTSLPIEHIPRDGWPNMKVQLWCYGWIDDWANAKLVTLVGDIWHKGRNSPRLSETCPRWRRDDPQFHKECLELFKCYGGEFIRGDKH